MDQSQFNRRARALRFVIEALRQHWAERLGVTLQTQFLLDTKPVPVVGYRRDKSHSDFAGGAAYGVCESRRLKYFGYQLVLAGAYRKDLQRDPEHGPQPGAMAGQDGRGSQRLSKN